MNILPKKMLINTAVLLLIIPSTFLHGMQSTSSGKSDTSNKYINAWTIGGTVAAIGCALGYFWWRSSRASVGEQRRKSLSKNQLLQPSALDNQSTPYAPHPDRTAAHAQPQASQQSSTAMVPSQPHQMAMTPVPQQSTAMMSGNYSSQVIPMPPMQQASALNVQTSSAYVVKNGSINEQFLAAVDSGNISNVKTLLCEYRANTNYQNEDGTSAGMLASAQGNQGMLEILKEQHIHNSGLTQRAILTLQNNKQERALHFATANGNVNALKTLLSGIYLQEREHAVNAQSQGGITPLHIAATKGHAHLVTLLMEAKGDINVQDNNGEVPLATARRFNQRHFINALSPYRKQMNKNKYLHNKDVFEEAFRWAAQQEKMQMQAQSTATSSSVTVEEVIDDNQPQPKTLQLENKQDS